MAMAGLPLVAVAVAVGPGPREGDRPPLSFPFACGIVQLSESERRGCSIVIQYYRSSQVVRCLMYR